MYEAFYLLSRRFRRFAVYSPYGSRPFVYTYRPVGMYCSRAITFVVLASCSISRFFRSIPPGAENPPGVPFDVIMRWQGMMRGIRFLLSALPTARAARGRPICCANSLYDIVSAGFMRLQRRKTRLVKSPAHDRSTLQLKSTCRPWK